MLRDTIRSRGIWGINLQPIRCPRCEESLPMVRKPASLNQALWGGWTCSKCSCEMDKWCVEIAPVKTSVSVPLGLEVKDQIPVEGHYEDSRTPLERMMGEK